MANQNSTAIPASCIATPGQNAAPRPFSATPTAPAQPKKGAMFYRNAFNILMGDPDINKQITGQIANVTEYTDEKGNVIHSAMGNYLLSKLGVCKINGVLHIYQDGLYREGVDLLHGHMINLVSNIPDAKRREVYKYLQACLKTPVKKVSPPHLIPFKSQIYNSDTGVFLDYSPEYVFLSRLPYDYIPDAPEQPLITDTIAQIADGDAEIIKLIYEVMGNCFYLENRYRGVPMLYGEHGNNGKSTLLNMIRQLVGRENTSSLSIHDLSERFRLVSLYGKIANIGDDISAAYLPDTETFKKLATGEYVTAEYKGQDAFDFVSFAKMFFAMNRLPPVSDKSRAFFSRLLVIPLNHDFSGSPNTSLKHRVWTQSEMEYLTVLAMSGLQRLRWQGGFTRPKAVTDLTAKYEQDNNPIMEFLDERGSIVGEPTAEVYAAFQAWSQSAGHRNIYTRRKFTDEVLAATGLQSRNHRHARYSGKAIKCYVDA